ncbi:MAG: hypothetical protein ACE5I2_11415 [Anaerolineae bacterium]
MHLLDEWDKHLESKETRQGQISEFEVLTRVHLIGTLDLGCAYLRFWEMPPTREKTAVRAAYLRTISYLSSEQLGRDFPPKKEQYYLPGGLPNEVVILLTLFTRAHFVLSRSLKIDEMPHMQRFPGGHEVARSEIDGQTIKLETVVHYFEMLKGLRLREKPLTKQDRKRRRVEPFMLAARLYHLALPLIYRDETLAYVCLVSAIESLLHDYGLDGIKLENWDEKVAQLVQGAVSDPEQYRAIERVLLTPPRLIKQRFKKFVIEHLSDEFWDDPTRPSRMALRFKGAAQVEKYVGRIYDARSSTLHKGAPFPPTVPGLNDEVPVGLGKSVGGKKEWKEKELLPSVRAFERLVHHVLKEYLQRESALGYKMVP